MKTRIVRLSDIARCPLHIMSAAHWVPEHRTEECDPEKRATMRLFDLDQKAQRRCLPTDQKEAREAFAVKIRKA